MIRNRKFLKAITAFLILETLFNTIAPTISWALTAGPTAPEATSFEPVDTSDMVNLATGDLAYNVPLLEVPGPSGGYPLSLSYHAGIQPNEEASWVGLGWTLNPGAITRTVNGFADDFSDIPQATRFYWNGGVTKTYEVGVTVGIGQAGVTAGLAYSTDTYQGAGIGMSLGVSAELIEGLGASAEIGISPYGDPHASAGLSLSTQLKDGESGAKASGSIGVSTNFKATSAYAGGGVSYKSNGGTKTDGSDDNSFSLVGASISTSPQGISSGGSMGGASLLSNSKSGRISTSTGGANITLPFGVVSVSLGYRYTRYWIDQIDNVSVNGALNYPTSPKDVAWYESHAYDTYSLLDKDSSVYANSDANHVLGGSFPNFDNFYVHAQGVAGAMRPYYFQKHLVNRNDYNVETKSNGDEYNEYKTIQVPLGYDSRKAEFRFIGEFSNRFEYTPPLITQYPDGAHSVNDPMGLNFNNGQLQISDSVGATYTSNRLAGSRHVEYLLNEDIGTVRASDVGFIETKSSGFSRGTQNDKSIGAMIITNESGVKYHFSLPAMASMEYSYSENINGTTTFNEFKNPTPYAYTWYLTAVTGPDYVDRGPNGQLGDGILNEYDWGYWVEFEYGKWTDQYFWRNPSEGMHTDIDGKFKNFSEGRKELYFLDAVRTKSHTAYFVKDIRHDAKSTIYSLRHIGNRGLKKNKETITPVTKEGGFKVKKLTAFCDRTYALAFRDQKGSVEYYSRPTSSLKLTEILLVQNKDGVAITKTNGTAYRQYDSANWQVVENETLCSDCETCDFSPVVFDHHLYQNVFDVYDLQAPGGVTLKNKAIRSIKFGTDYSLTPGTSNSFDFNLVKGDEPDVSQTYPLFGKLTLNSVHFLGKAGEDLMPPIKFGYEPQTPAEGQSTLMQPDPTRSVYSFTKVNSGLGIGSIIKFSNSYALVMSADQVSGAHSIRMISGSALNGQIIYWKETNNPPYDKDRTDIWGLYKPDLRPDLLATHEGAARLVSPESAHATDAWSLRTIQSSMGSKVHVTYEPDSYKKPVLVVNHGLRVEDLRPMSNSSHWEVVLYDHFEDMDEIIKTDSELELTYFIADPYLSNQGKGFGDRINTIKIPVHDVRYAVGSWIIETQNLSGLFETRPVDYERELVFYAPHFIAGNIPLQDNVANFGGGIRVKSIRATGHKGAKETSYIYTSTGNSSPSDTTSGVTSYEPGGMDQTVYHYPQSPSSVAEHFANAADREEGENLYRELLNKNFSTLLVNAREIPPPGVIYEYVTIKEKVIHNNGTEVPVGNYSTYHFQVFIKGMIDMLYEYDRQEKYPTNQVITGYQNATNWTKTRRVVLKNFAGSVGTLKTISLFDHEGHVLSKTTNHYLNDDIIAQLSEEDFEENAIAMEQRIQNQFKGQGIVEETYTDAKYVRQEGLTLDGREGFHLMGTVSKREEFPNISIGQTTINYKTGIKSENRNLAFDFYTGSVLKSSTTDGYGNTFVTESVPAYTVEQYGAMGFAAKGGKNMLTQQAASYTYKVDPTQNNKPIAIVSASATTWSDQIPALRETQYPGSAAAQPGVWRMKGSYAFVGDDQIPLRADGLHAMDVYNPDAHQFSSWTTNEAPAGWQRTSLISLYDVNSHALQVEDVNQNFAATKYSSDQSHIYATVANAGYEEFAYSGAEDAVKSSQFGGNVIASGTVEGVIEHTGSNSVSATAGNRSFTYTFNPKQRTYRVSVWTSQPMAAVKYKINNGATQSATVNHLGQAGSWHIASQEGNWHLLEADIVLSSDPTQLEVWCESTVSATHFDDFRICPLDAAMSSYVYNSYGELSHILDGNNLFTEFTYDAVGRLIKTRKETLSYGVVKTTENKYYYANQN